MGMGRCTGRGARPAPVTRSTPQKLHLALDPLPPVGEVLAQGLVLDGVPSEADTEPEPAAGEKVDFGRLLGDQGRLPLRENDDPGDELQRCESGQVAEEHERLVEGRVEVVGARPSLVDGRVGPHHVVVGDDVGVTELFHPGPVGAHGAGVTADLGLGEHDADLHGGASVSGSDDIITVGHVGPGHHANDKGAAASTAV
jgi:hypothetical protein